jgi:hypothetical protein
VMDFTHHTHPNNVKKNKFFGMPLYFYSPKSGVELTSKQKKLTDIVKKKSKLSQFWGFLEIKMVLDIKDAHEVKENLMNVLSTVGIIGALFGSMMVPLFADPPIEEEPGFNSFIGFIRICAVMSGLGSAIFSGLYMGLLSTVPTENIHAWILKNTNLLPLPAFGLFGCLTAFSFDQMMSGAIYYGPVLAVIIVFGLCAMLVCFFVVAVTMTSHSSANCLGLDLEEDVPSNDVQLDEVVPSNDVQNKVATKVGTGSSAGSSI